MKLAGGLGIGSIISAGLASVVLNDGLAPDFWMGMLGPTVAVVAAWLIMERTSRKRPGQLTAVQTRLFFAKMLFFGAYVGGILGMGLVRPYPFVLSFTAYFVVLYGIHAFALYRLMNVQATR